MYIFSTDLKMIYRSKLQKKKSGKLPMKLKNQANVHNFQEKILSHA